MYQKIYFLHPQMNKWRWMHRKSAWVSKFWVYLKPSLQNLKFDFGFLKYPLMAYKYPSMISYSIYTTETKHCILLYDKVNLD